MVIGLVVYVANQDKLPIEAAPTASTTTPWLGVGAFVVAVPIAVVALLWLLTLPPLVPIAIATVVLASCLAWLIRLPRDERPRVMAICAACMVTAAFWAVYEQQGNTLQLWATGARIGRRCWLHDPSTRTVVQPFMIGSRDAAQTSSGHEALRGREPTSLQKMAIGCVVSARLPGDDRRSSGMAPGAQSHVMWLVASSAISRSARSTSRGRLSVVTKVAPGGWSR